MAPPETRTGVTGEFAIINAAASAAVETGNMAQAKKIRTMAEGLVTIISEHLSAATKPTPAVTPIQAPPIIIKPGSTERRIISIAEALDIMQGRVLGMEEFNTTYGHHLTPDQLPPLTASTQELINIAALGDSLALRYDKRPNGEPLTMKGIHEDIAAVNAKKPEISHRRALYSIDKNDCWYKDELFFQNQTPHTGWAQISGEPLPDTFSTYYLEQTDSLIAHLQATFKGMKIPQQYQDAIAQYEQQKAEIKQLVHNNQTWQTGSQRLVDLAITQQLRPTPVEASSDTNIGQENNKPMLTGTYTNTSARSSDGSLVSVGSADVDGAVVDGWDPGDRDDDLGASFSRRLS